MPIYIDSKCAEIKSLMFVIFYVQRIFEVIVSSFMQTDGQDVNTRVKPGVERVPGNSASNIPTHGTTGMVISRAHHFDFVIKPSINRFST